MKAWAATILFTASMAAQAQHTFKLSGDFWGVHDPSIAKDGNTWYVFATGKAPRGGQMAIRCSKDLKAWTLCGQVFDKIPTWIAKESPRTTELWAPDISHYKDEFRLYYAYSLFGKNTSGIALATNKTLDPESPEYQWVDKGLVLRSAESDDYNAIDPNFHIDAQGNSWLAFGSFWGGIKMRRLNDEGMPSTKDTRLYSLAARAKPANAEPPASGSPANWQAIEAPFLVHHGSYYYLFVSWDLCCKGSKSTYRTMVGRAAAMTGPYLDRSGKGMQQGGGTQLLGGNAEWAGPGGESVLPGTPDDLIVYHAYDAKTGKPALQISTIAWTDRWPHVALEAHHGAVPK